MFLLTRNQFTSVKSQRLSDSAVDQVVELVRSGRLAPGTQLPSEREIVRQLGVSRTSYREAVRILETMGILRVVSGRGTWIVDEPDWAAVNLGTGWLATHERDVFELLEVRDALDVKAVALAARRGTEEQLAAIGDGLESIRRAAADGEVDEIFDADTAFHAAIAAASGNKVLKDALDSVYESLAGTRRAMICIPGRLRRMDVEHRALSEAILSRDPEAAARTMAQHSSRVEDEVSVAIHAEQYLAVTDRSAR
jgi:GntR family transcriptional regulator, transcriptional repressor for pyruvate dehydrogenase complex